MTPFRRSQARAVLTGIVRALAPQMSGADSLRRAVRELADDSRLWAELQRVPTAAPESDGSAVCGTCQHVGGRHLQSCPEAPWR